MAKDISSEPAQKMVDEEVAKVRAAMIERAKDSHQPAAKAVELCPETGVVARAMSLAAPLPRDGGSNSKELSLTSSGRSPLADNRFALCWFDNRLQPPTW